MLIKPDGKAATAISGAGRVTVKLVSAVADPACVKTLIGPVVALAGTLAEIRASLLTANVAEMPLNATRFV